MDEIVLVDNPGQAGAQQQTGQVSLCVELNKSMLQYYVDKKTFNVCDEKELTRKGTHP